MMGMCKSGISLLCVLVDEQDCRENIEQTEELVHVPLNAIDQGTVRMP